MLFESEDLLGLGVSEAMAVNDTGKELEQLEGSRSRATSAPCWPKPPAPCPTSARPRRSRKGRPAPGAIRATAMAAWTPTPPCSPPATAQRFGRRSVSLYCGISSPWPWLILLGAQCCFFFQFASAQYSLRLSVGGHCTFCLVLSSTQRARLKWGLFGF